MERKDFIKKSAIAGIGLATIPSIILSACNNPDDKSTGNSGDANAINGPFAMAQLAYGYDAFTEVIDAQTMDIHYNKHYKGYTDKLNKALAENNIKDKAIEDILMANELPTAIENNGGGYYNHTLYWDILTPGGKAMSADFEKNITDNFGSKDAFINELTEAGKKRFGSGWAWLVQDADKQLKITSTPNQDNPLMANAELKGTPLLGIDVWEHAYYLKYQNKRGDYLNNIFKIINWESVAGRMS